jgi:putative NADPH-quinone reductase
MDEREGGLQEGGGPHLLLYVSTGGGRRLQGRRHRLMVTSGGKRDAMGVRGTRQARVRGV